MFEFTRGGTKYFIKYADGSDDNLLICAFYDADQQRYRWVHVADTDDIDSPIVYKGDEMEFLRKFLADVNRILDEYFGLPDIPDQSSTAKERLNFTIKTKLRFNEETQHVEII